MNDPTIFNSGLVQLAGVWWKVVVGIVFLGLGNALGTYVALSIAEQGSILAWFIRVVIIVPTAIFGTILGILFERRLKRVF